MVAVRVSPTEFADWRAKAAAAGVPLSGADTPGDGAHTDVDHPGGRG